MYKKQQFHVGCEPISLIGRPYSKKAGYVIEVFGCEGEQDFHFEMRRIPAEKSWRLIQTDTGRQQAGSHGTHYDGRKEPAQEAELGQGTILELKELLIKRISMRMSA
jgi:hypothetical protein